VATATSAPEVEFALALSHCNNLLKADPAKLRDCVSLARTSLLRESDATIASRASDSLGALKNRSGFYFESYLVRLQGSASCFVPPSVALRKVRLPPQIELRSLAVEDIDVIRRGPHHSLGAGTGEVVACGGVAT